MLTLELSNAPFSICYNFRRIFFILERNASMGLKFLLIVCLLACCSTNLQGELLERRENVMSINVMAVLALPCLL